MKLRSQIAWVTFRPEDAIRAREIIDALRGDNTVDVLGLQRPMEQISELLFPATSTLHKRIRYQIFVPSILWAIYQRGTSVDARTDLRAYEFELQKTLIANGEKANVFGVNQGEALKYWPSLVYWNSLNRLHFWGQTHQTQQQVFDVIDRTWTKRIVNDDGTTEEDTPTLEVPAQLQEIAQNLFPKQGPKLNSEKIRFSLTRPEAKFLFDRFVTLHPESLTTYILKHKLLAHSKGDRDWYEVPVKSNASLKRLILEAKRYSQVAAGATYAYRWALLKARVPKSEGIQKNEEYFERWNRECKLLTESWRYSRLTSAIGANPLQEDGNDGEEAFVDMFLKLTRGSGGTRRKLTTLQEFLSEREAKVKGRNRSHFENREIAIPKNTHGDQAYSSTFFDYRWKQGKANAVDVMEGLLKR